MCAKRHLQCVECGCICMAHEPRHRRSKGHAPQPRSRTVAAIRSSAGCRRANEERFRHLSSASVSLSSTGLTSETASSRRRQQDRFYRKTFTSISPAPSRFRNSQQSIAKRNCQSRSTRGLAAATRAWLSVPHSTATLFSLYITLIACSLKNLSKSTNCSCPKSAVRWDRRN